MDYQKVPLGVKGQFELNGVRFSGGSFIYWKKSTTTNITDIIIVFDKKYESIGVKDGVVVLSLKGIINYQDLSEAIRIFLKILNVIHFNVRLLFIVENDNQRQVAEALGNTFGISFLLQNVNSNLENVEQNINQINNEKSNLVDSLSDDVEQVFYLDGNNILNDDGLPIGSLGNDGYEFHFEDNSLYKNGRKIGYIGDYKNMKSNGASLGNGKVLTFKNPNAGPSFSNPDHVAPSLPNRSAAFVSFPVIMFILSALMLIGSIMLLFILD